jgi:hypothetical protein
MTHVAYHYPGIGGSIIACSACAEIAKKSHKDVIDAACEACKAFEDNELLKVRKS